MTGYFDALLRSGGMLSDQRSVTSPVARAEAEPLAQESEQFDRTPPAADVPMPLPSTPPRLPGRKTAEFEPTHEAVEEGFARTDAPLAASPSEPSLGTTEFPGAHVSARPSGGVAEDVGRTLVKAALRWVAAAPKQAHTASEPSPAHTDAMSASQPRAERTAFAIDRESNEMRAATTEAPFRQHSDDRGPLSARILPSEHALAGGVERAVGRAADMASPVNRPTVSKPRDETVEVSIGAIHVRVDAPQTRAGAMTTTPRANSPLPGAVRARSENAPHNSRLARRGLRRI